MAALAEPLRPKLTILAGPTGSGKTALGVRLAEACGGEIVSADSQQVYRHFDIGTAKPTPAQLASVRHHLISIVEPNEQFTAAQFQTHADAAIADIASRGRRVFVVGGTGLYLRVLLHGVSGAPPSNAQVRARLAAEAAELGREALHARLNRVDPVTASRLSPQDWVRVSRALEIHELSGQTASHFSDAHRFETERYPYELFVLHPERAWLYAAIDERTRELFAAGLVEEVRQLVRQGFRNTPPMRSVGYRQALDVVEGRLSPEHAEQSTAQETRRFAKRQGTWFRKERAARFVGPPYEEIS